jgi:hypothetical protein
MGACPQLRTGMSSEEPRGVDLSAALKIIDSLAVLIFERATFLSETFD